MSVNANPYQLRYAAQHFSMGAAELRDKVNRLRSSKANLTEGHGGWVGDGAESFSARIQQYEEKTRRAAVSLESTANTLNGFANQMERVIELRNRAHQLEMESYEVGGDAMDDLHRRQSLLHQAHQLRQEAEWEANAADSQAEHSFRAIMAEIQAIDVWDSGTTYHTGNGNYDDLPEPLRSYYSRHPELFKEDQDSTDRVADEFIPTISEISVWDKIDGFMTGGVDGTKEFVFGLLSSIVHPVQTAEDIIYSVTNPRVFLNGLLEKKEQIVNDWNSGNTYGWSKSLHEIVWSVIGLKRTGLSEDAAESASNATRSGVDALRNIVTPSAKVVFPDGTVVRVADRILKDNEEFAEYEEARINEHLAGSEHPKTQVPFDENGFPIFESVFDAQLDSSLLLESDAVQFREANRQLYEAILKNPELASEFSEKDIANLAKGRKPSGYTWHHNQETGKLQFVNTLIHKQTGHTGGRSIWGGGSDKR